MANKNPKTENLALGRGKRPKLGNETVSMRMSGQTRQTLESIASSYGCFYGGKPWIAGLLDKIGSGTLMIVPAPPKIVDEDNIFDPNQAMQEHLRQKHYSSSDENVECKISESGEEYLENAPSSSCMPEDTHRSCT